MSDQPRPDATSPDQYSLTIEEAALRYEHAGYPRTLRSIQRYCARGDLDCLRQETTFGDKFMITPQSVARHIAQIDELASATHRDQPRQDATPVALQTHDDEPERQVPTSPDKARPDAAGQAPSGEDRADEHYVAQLEKRIEEKDEFIGLLKGQLAAKDEQISEQTERARETNFLIKGLQELVLRLQLGSSPPQQGTGT